MFVRRQINKSGSISISVVDKSRGRYEVVKSFGAVRSAAEADLLENRAREFVREQTGEPTLFGGMSEAQLRDCAALLDQGRVELAGPELLFGAVFDRLGLGKGFDGHFRHLVICRLFSPGSKRRTVDYLRRYLGQAPDESELYRYVDGLRLNGYPDGKDERRADACCQLFTLDYAPARKADGKAPAKSRGPKPRMPRVRLALLLSREGSPLACRILDKDLSESRLQATLRRFASKSGVSSFRVVRDADPLLEEAFRMNKMDLQFRPFCRRMKGRIEGHLCVCMAAYAIQVEWTRLLRDNGCEISLDQLREAAATMFRLNYISPYTKRPKSVLVQMTPLQKRLFDLVHPS